MQSECDQSSQMISHSFKSAKSFLKYSEINAEIKTIVIEDCRHLTDSIFPGLDLEKEILCVFDQKIGKTILTYDSSGSKLTKFAICHYGKGSEARSKVYCIKFGSGSPRNNAQSNFVKLIGLIEKHGSRQRPGKNYS